MFTVKTPEEVLELIQDKFDVGNDSAEGVPLAQACGRVLAESVSATEYVPDFNRSTVDGYAVKASDTFGSSESIPAILTMAGEVRMGKAASGELQSGCCMAVPTGAEVPIGADAVVMIEYSEDYRDGTIGILKSVAPGNNMIFRGDDVFPGKHLLKAGRKLTPQDIGALAALGISSVQIRKKPVIGIISTGDELIPVGEKPEKGQVRDVNSSMLVALIEHSCGACAKPYGIIRDQEELLVQTLNMAVKECDAVLVSGGSSVGMKDATCRVIERFGEILFHGIAMKPGKPTIFGLVGGIPVIGLPGHPVAAFFVTHLFVKPLIGKLTGETMTRKQIAAVLSETVNSNHGRAEYMGVFLREEGGMLYADPIRGKSGLITALAGSDGYFCIGRDCEGIFKGTEIMVTYI